MASNNNITAQAIHQKPSAETLQGARDAVWVAGVGVCCIETHISPILVAIEALARVDGMADKDLAKRIAAIQKLAHVGVLTADDMTNTMDCERESMQGKLNALEGVPA